MEINKQNFLSLVKVIYVAMNKLPPEIRSNRHIQTMMAASRDYIAERTYSSPEKVQTTYEETYGDKESYQ